MLTLIGISGKKESGKDSLCTAISKVSALPTMRIGFADALKEEVALACNVSVSFIEANKASFRLMLQWWGTDFRRKWQGDDYWVKKLLVKVACAGGGKPVVVVVPDVRFLSEANVLKEIGAYLIRIERPSLVSTDTHSSECELDRFKEFDYTVMNDMEIQKLLMYAEQLLKHFKIPTKNNEHHIHTTKLSHTRQNNNQATG